MNAKLDRLKPRLERAAIHVADCKVRYEQFLVEERELERHKVQAKEALDAARDEQRKAVFEALRAGGSPRAIARDYRLSPATVHKYGQPQ